jgi:amino acid transporter
MTKESLGRRLAREASEYLTDLREIRDELKNREGWIALALVIAAVVIAAIWVLVSLGFNPANDEITANLRKFGMHSCRPIDNFSGVILFVNMILLLFLTVMTMGNIIRMLGRVKRGWPREPRDLVISASLMLATGIGGIIYMRWIC